LLLRMCPRVARIGFERVDCEPLHSDHGSFPLGSRPSARALTCVGYGSSGWGELRFGSCHADRIAGLRALTAHLTVSHCAVRGSRYCRGASPAGIAHRPVGRHSSKDHRRPGRAKFLLGAGHEKTPHCGAWQNQIGPCRFNLV
jgi:hypothetical protein